MLLSHGVSLITIFNYRYIDNNFRAYCICMGIKPYGESYSPIEFLMTCLARIAQLDALNRYETSYKTNRYRDCSFTQHTQEEARLRLEVP